MIFRFNSYKHFLKDYLKQLPKHGRGEVRRWAEAIDVSPSFLSQVISGPRDLGFEQAKKLANYLSLSFQETDYFLILVLIDRAGTQDLKQFYIQKRESMQIEADQVAQHMPQDHKLTDADRATFYSSPLFSQVHLLTSLGDGLSVDQIAARIGHSRERAQEICKFLLQTGLIVARGHLYQMHAHTTHIEKGSPYLINHHRNWRIAAIQKAEKLLDEELMYTGNFSVSKKDFKLLRAKMLETIKEFSKVVSESDAEEVANLNLDLFWV